jgi:hypothetical protein
MFAKMEEEVRGSEPADADATANRKSIAGEESPIVDRHPGGENGSAQKSQQRASLGADMKIMHKKWGCFCGVRSSGDGEF